MTLKKNGGLSLNFYFNETKNPDDSIHQDFLYLVDNQKNINIR